MKRFVVIASTLAIAATAAAGCGEGPPSPDEIRGIEPGVGTQEADNSTVYAQTLERAFSTTEDPSLPPIDQAFANGDTKAIKAINGNWSAARKLLEQAEPPEDAASAHNDLVTSMRKLEDWNNRILQASRTSKKKTQAVAKDARNSSAARQYGQALEVLGMLGYIPAQDDLAG